MPALSWPLLAVLAAAPAGAVPLQFSVQGRLTDSQGVNRDGSFDLTARLWTAPSGGTLLYEQANQGVPVVNGNFSLLLGGAAGQPALDQVLTGAVVYLEFQAAGESAMVPRQTLLSVPYALRAGRSEALATPPVSAQSKRGLAVTVGASSVRVKADAVSVGNAGFTAVDITKAVGGLTPTAWHSINLVTDAAGSFVDVCVVQGLLADADAGTRCRAGAVAARRVGWAYARADGTLRAAFSTGDWWSYDVPASDLLVFGGSISTSYTAYSLAAWLPPTARRAKAMGYLQDYSTQVSGLLWRPTGGTLESSWVTWGVYSNQTSLEIVTDANQSLDVHMWAGNSGGIVSMWLASYYDPE